MTVTLMQLAMMVATIGIIIGAGIWSAGRIKSSESFSLNGRKASAGMVAGAIAGSCIGGGATIGTSQMAFTFGISAWWFTIGIGTGFLLMGMFFARRFRESGRETITQLLIDTYGSGSGPVASLISSCGIFFAAVASVLPAIHIISQLLSTTVYTASAILFFLIIVYIYFGGIKGASVSGLLKSVILWLMLFAICITAGRGLLKVDSIENIIPHGLDLFAQGIWMPLENVISMSAGLLCAQNYAQAIFSAKDVKAARTGCFAAAALSLPVGIPCIMASMYMKANHPEVSPIMALPEFALHHLPEPLSGVTLGVLIIALISSIAGLTLGISTLLTRDIWTRLFRLSGNSEILRANRLSVIMISVLTITFSLCHLESQVLTWNLLALALRAGVFIPLVLALYRIKLLPPLWAVPTMLTGTLAAGIAKPVLHTGIPPLFLGFAVALLMIAMANLAGQHFNYRVLRLMAETKRKLPFMHHA